VKADAQEQPSGSFSVVNRLGRLSAWNST
jgi:hypothetical protein